jgi:hypothetical protein
MVNRTMTGAGLATGTVRAVSQNQFMVVAQGSAFKAEKAAGCLLQPEAGDEVFCAGTEDGRYYILSVLTRADSQALAHLSAGDHVEWKGLTCRVDFKESIECRAPRTELTTDRAQATFDQASLLGGRLACTVRSMRLVANNVELKAGSILERAGRVYRRIADFEESQIGRVRMLVEDVFFVKAKNAKLKADQHVSVNGEKIELG